MPVTTQRMTAAEFMALPEDPNEIRYELVHGEVVVSPSPNMDHGWVITRLTVLLGTFIEANSFGQLYSDIDTYFSTEDVRRPDLLFFANDRLHLLKDRYPEGPPTLCIEILSPSNIRTDRVDKFNLYEATGVPFYWIVDPIERTMEGYELQNGVYASAGRGKENDLLRLKPFENVTISLSHLWRS